MQYLALIGDICGSRQVDDRGGLQRSLKAALAAMNERYGDALASPLTLTLGDEFQALFSDPLPLWRLITTIQVDLYPVRMRFGLGVGALATAINRDAALGMDGPVFYRARDAIGELQERGGFYRVEGLAGSDLANESLALVSRLQESWQRNRLVVYRDYLGDGPVKATAATLGISKTAVYKNIRDGLLEPVAGIQRAIAGQMAEAMRL